MFHNLTRRLWRTTTRATARRMPSAHLWRLTDPTYQAGRRPLPPGFARLRAGMLLAVPIVVLAAAPDQSTAAELVPVLVGAAVGVVGTLLVTLLIQAVVVPRVQAYTRRLERWEDDLAELSSVVEEQLPRALKNYRTTAGVRAAFRGRSEMNSGSGRPAAGDRSWLWQQPGAGQAQPQSGRAAGRSAQPR
jgi:hypothetical protein